MGNGRTFAHRCQEQYDLVFTSLADTQVANNQGAQILSENHLYTVEAYEAFWDRLSEDGVCTTVCGAGWGGVMLRLITTVIAAMENKGVADPGAHLCVVVTPPLGPGPLDGLCIAFSKRPFPAETIERTRAVCEKLGYPMAWPRYGGGHAWGADIEDLIDPAARQGYLDSAYADLSALHDSRPYLFYALKPKAFLELLVNPQSGSDEIRPRLRAFHLLIDLFLAALGMLFPSLLRLVGARGVDMTCWARGDERRGFRAWQRGRDDYRGEPGHSGHVPVRHRVLRPRGGAPCFYRKISR